MDRKNLLLAFILIICYSMQFCQCETLETSIKSQPTVYLVKLGDTVKLPCEIVNRRQATVIWQFSSKNRIPETLTIGNFYYRKDFRIRVLKNTSVEREQSWDLEIRKINLSDEGYYYCKVMAEPESLKREILLKVQVDMAIEPLNPIVDYNKPLTIFCNTSVERESSEHAVYRAFKRNLNHARINWYKDGVRLHHHKANMSIMDSISIHQYSSPTISSKLRIGELNAETVGVYTCRFRFQNVTTHVVERSVANQRILIGVSDSSMVHVSSSVALNSLLVLCFLIRRRLCC